MNIGRGLPVTNLCDSCKDNFALCKGEIVVWGKDIEKAFPKIKIGEKYKDAVVVCENYAREESEAEG